MMIGHGLEVPMPVILLGVIGGVMAFGLVGLFIGAVVLAVGYVLFSEWVGTSAPGTESHIKPEGGTLQRCRVKAYPSSFVCAECPDKSRDHDGEKQLAADHFERRDSAGDVGARQIVAVAERRERDEAVIDGDELGDRIRPGQAAGPKAFRSTNRSARRTSRRANMCSRPHRRFAVDLLDADGEPQRPRRGEQSNQAVKRQHQSGIHRQITTFGCKSNCDEQHAPRQ